MVFEGWSLFWIWTGIIATIVAILSIVAIVETDDEIFIFPFLFSVILVFFGITFGISLGVQYGYDDAAASQLAHNPHVKHVFDVEFANDGGNNAKNTVKFINEDNQICTATFHSVLNRYYLMDDDIKCFGTVPGK